MNERNKELNTLVDMVIMQNPLTVLGYKNGVKQNINILMGYLGKSSKGKYAPGEILDVLNSKLKKT